MGGGGGVVVGGGGEVEHGSTDGVFFLEESLFLIAHHFLCSFFQFTLDLGFLFSSETEFKDCANFFGGYRELALTNGTRGLVISGSFLSFIIFQ